MRSLLLALAACLVTASRVVWAAEPTPAGLERARIPHLDGSGRATVVEIDPRVPGAKNFVNAPSDPVPRPGELVLPPKAAAQPSPSPARP